MARKSVRVGGITYRLVSVKDLRSHTDVQLWGEIKHGLCEIRLNPELTPQARRQCTWHEIMHAVFTQAGRAEESADESLVEVLAYAMVQILRDNPWLAEPA